MNPKARLRSSRFYVCKPLSTYSAAPRPIGISDRSQDCVRLRASQEHIQFSTPIYLFH